MLLRDIMIGHHRISFIKYLLKQFNNMFLSQKKSMACKNLFVHCISTFTFHGKETNPLNSGNTQG